MNNRKDAKNQKETFQPLYPKKAVLIDTLPADAPSVRGCFDFQPPDKNDRCIPDEIAGLATCYFRGVCTDIALLVPTVKPGVEDNHLDEYINKSNVVIYAAADFAAAKLFIERHLPVKSAYSAAFEQLMCNNLDTMKHVYVVPDEKIAAQLKQLITGLKHAPASSVYALSTFNDEYRQAITRTRASLLQYPNNSIFTIGSQGPIFEIVQSYLGNSATYIRDKLLTIFNQITNNNMPTWYDKLKLELDKYAATKANEDHKSDHQAFFNTVRGQQVKKLIDAVDKAGQFYSNEKEAQAAYNEVVQMIHTVVADKLFFTTGGRLINKNRLHHILESFRSILQPIVIEKHGRDFTVGGGGGE